MIKHKLNLPSPGANKKDDPNDPLRDYRDRRPSKCFGCEHNLRSFKEKQPFCRCCVVKDIVRRELQPDYEADY